jgi:hypothetical protein
VKRILPASKRFARAFPIHHASVYRSEGNYLWLTGNHQAAQAAWQKSLELARRHRLPYAEGMAHFEMARHSEGAQRQQSLEQARAILTKIGALYDLNRIPES